MDARVVIATATMAAVHVRRRPGGGKVQRRTAEPGMHMDGAAEPAVSFGQHDA
jgi:hypothetical protein